MKNTFYNKIGPEIKKRTYWIEHHAMIPKHINLAIKDGSCLNRFHKLHNPKMKSNITEALLDTHQASKYQNHCFSADILKITIIWAPEL